ncbi:MAG: urea ABC transporter permease subunit UrtB, partial [Paraglaciecola sp.]
MLRMFSLLLLLVISGYSHAQTESTTATALEPLLQQLPKTKLRQMDPLVKQIADVKHAKTRTILQVMLDGELYYVKANKQLVKAQKAQDRLYTLTPIMSDETLAAVKKSKISKVKTNNRLRSTLRSLIAKIDLTDDDKSIRLQAVQQLLNSPTKESTSTISELIDSEQDEEVRELMSVTMALQQLQDGVHSEKLEALIQLDDSLEPTVKNTIIELLTKLPETELTAEQQTLKLALNKALEGIESQASFYGFIENVFFGLSLGSVLLLAAIGLAITFGVMGVINMAHGEMIMLGAYTTYVIQIAFPSIIEYSLLIAIPAAFLVSGLVGILIERGVIRFLKGRPLETLLATFGISLILQQLVRTVFSPLNRQVISPEWMSGSWQINPIFSLTYNRLYIILFSIMVFVSLLLILKKTSLGLHVRAVSQNRDMARALSVKSDWVDA